MSKIKKQDMIVNLDIGMFGTLVSAIRKNNDPDYLIIRYIPLQDSFFKKNKVIEYPRAVHRSHFHTVKGTSDVPGVEETIHYIVEQGANSHMHRILDDKESEIRELRAERDRYRKQSGFQKLEADTARDNVNKTIARNKEANKGTNIIRSGFEQPFVPGRRDAVNPEEYDSFE